MSQDSIHNVAYKSFDGSVEDLFLDIEASGDSVKVVRRVSVSVSYLPHEYEELREVIESWRESSVKRVSKLRSIVGEAIDSFDSFHDFWAWCENNVFPLWITPFVIVKLSDYLYVKDRGLFYRAFVTKKRVRELFNYAYSKYRSHFRVKRHKTRHLVVTVTIPHSDWKTAPETIVKRLKEVVNYFRRKYGLVFYVCVLELHEDGFPHFHCLFVVKKQLHVFKHKGLWRFSSKRQWDNDLRTSEKGFIDCFALKGGKKAITSYFMKYVNKFFKYPIENLNVKESVLLYCRLFRVRPVYHSRLPRLSKAPISLSDKEKELARLCYEYSIMRPKTIKEHVEREELKKRIVDDLINISPIRSESPIKTDLMSDTWLRFNVEFFNRLYRKLNKIYCVLGRSCIVFTHN
ncbi:MAG: hypothetical protein QXX12_05465 [Nanopusillaceae archaeon]